MIIICEPNCPGFEHAEVNAGLLAVAAEAFSAKNIVFAAEKEHIKQVSTILAKYAITGIEYKTIDIPPRHRSELVRGLPEFILCRRIFQAAADRKINTILFCSVTNTGLISIKIMLRMCKKIRAMVIPHAPIESILIFPKRWYLGFPLIFWFRYALLFGNTKRITYLELGSFIEKALRSRFPKLGKFVRSIDLPYFFKTEEKSIYAQNKIIRFASLGSGNAAKGTESFYELADRIKPANTKYKAEFILNGHLVTRRTRNLRSVNVIFPSADKPLTFSDYEQWAKKMDYAVFLYDYKFYRLSTSASLFDAFSYLKPIIALRVPVFEHYFNLMGDIGYLCDTIQEVEDVILNILNNDLSAKYENQRQALLRGREKLNLSILSNNFKAACGPINM